MKTSTQETTELAMVSALRVIIRNARFNMALEMELKRFESQFREYVCLYGKAHVQFGL